MSARFAAILVAFATATAVVSRPHLLAEMLVQLNDPNVLGGPLFATLLKTFGFVFVVALCATLTGGAIVLVAWRTRTRGAPDAFGCLAAILAAFCLIPRLGVSLDPIGWICAAGFALTLDRDDGASVADGLSIVTVWALLQGGAPLAIVLAVLALIGMYLDRRRLDRRVRTKAAMAGGAIVLGMLQLAAAPWHGYGAHVLYLDALNLGAQRDRLWSGAFTATGLSFCAVVVLAAWYGVKRRGRIGDALVFFVMMLLAMVDARNLPYFGIIAAPIVADAIASYYVDRRTFPLGSVAQYAFTFFAAAAAFIAVVTTTEPKVTVWPQAAEQPATLLIALAADHRRHHHVICEQPRWCDGAQNVFPNLSPVLDDRSGVSTVLQRQTQQDAVATQGNWRDEMRRERVDAVIATSQSNLVSLLTSTGWRQAKVDGVRVLLQPAGER